MISILCVYWMNIINYKGSPSSNHGMKTEQLASLVNEKGLYKRLDGKPVDGRQVYAVIMAHPDTFVKSEGLIRLMI